MIGGDEPTSTFIDTTVTDARTTSSLIGGAGLALLGTTCCALPIALVALGMGGAVASMMSIAPWLVTLSQYKLVTFTATGLVIGYCWWRVRSVQQCEVGEQTRLRRQKVVLWATTAIFFISIFAAYALYPIARYIGQGS